MREIPQIGDETLSFEQIIEFKVEREQNINSPIRPPMQKQSAANVQFVSCLR